MPGGLFRVHVRHRKEVVYTDAAKYFFAGVTLWLFIAVGYGVGSLAERVARLIVGLLFQF